ncbi:PREDICTED: uncharacterized protein LOC108553443 [Eufriesea mexicana]|uniref:uncharacterized protein LOC108553443 n=1 Tax=Eufriesea mexicana TaxID=516756 RepID=UPI00083BDE01|nr:PREDICTED: uncharacterized protein LOC108553443 [Eufriesea mexicana]
MHISLSRIRLHRLYTQNTLITGDLYEEHGNVSSVSGNTLLIDQQIKATTSQFSIHETITWTNDDYENLHLEVIVLKFGTPSGKDVNSSFAKITRNYQELFPTITEVPNILEKEETNIQHYTLY